MRTAHTAALLLTLLGVQTLTAQEEVTIREGVQVYSATCNRCHNARGPSERSDREWGVIMLHMRTRGILSGRETRAVLTFLQATNGTSSSGPNQDPDVLGVAMPGDTGPEEIGRGLIEKNGCMACHKVGKFTTGTLGPDLNTVLDRRTAEWVLQKLADPKLDNPTTMMPQMNLSLSDREAILAYLKSIAK